MTQPPDRSTSQSWARFRFSVVGSLLSSPPARGRLKAALRALAEKTWSHPVSGREVRFAVVTIERWYYTARQEKDDPVGVLRRAVRRDCGKVSQNGKQECFWASLEGRLMEMLHGVTDLSLALLNTATQAWAEI